MKGYEGIRDNLRDNPSEYVRLDAAQLFKHAFALRTEAVRRRKRKPKPILFYLYAEPERWPDGKPVDETAKVRHRDEIETFRATVADDEVVFLSCPYRRLLSVWKEHGDDRIRAHAEAVMHRFSP